MEPYRIGDAVRVRSFDELKADPEVVLHGFSGDGNGFYGIDDCTIDNWAESGLLFIREVGTSNGTAGGTDYILETADGGPIPYYWLHCMLHPYEFGSEEEPIDPGSLEDLFDFLHDQ